jgi:hypothetical protein
MANGITATYISANQFSVIGDQTQDFHADRRVKAELTGGDVYSTISGSSYSVTTTVTLNDSELDNTLTLVWYGVGIGSEGSLPNHSHDGFEGTGGIITISGVNDHGTLLGLTDDDHTQYSLADGTRPFTGEVEFGGASALEFTSVTGTIGLTTDQDLMILTSGTVTVNGDIYCTDLFASASSIHLGDLDLSYDGFSLINPAHLTVGGDVNFDADVVPTSSGTSKIGHPDKPLLEIYLVDQATGDPYNIAVVSGTLVATPV